MKKGFTIVEIIISIGIIALIGSIIVFSINKKDNKISKVDETILESAKVFATAEVDESGNNYLSQLLTYAKGVKIPLKTLESKGYITENTTNEIYEKYDEKLNREEGNDYYVLLANSGEDYCKDDSTINIYGSWMESDSPIYLCNTKASVTTYDNIIDKIIADNNVVRNHPFSDEMFLFGDALFTPFSLGSLYSPNGTSVPLFESSLSFANLSTNSQFGYKRFDIDFSSYLKQGNLGKTVISYPETVRSILIDDTYCSSCTGNNVFKSNHGKNEKYEYVDGIGDSLFFVNSDTSNAVEGYYNLYNGLYYTDSYKYFFRGNITNNYLYIGDDLNDINDKGNINKLYRIAQFDDNEITIISLGETSLEKSDGSSSELIPRLAGCYVHSDALVNGKRFKVASYYNSRKIEYGEQYLIPAFHAYITWDGQNDAYLNYSTPLLTYSYQVSFNFNIDKSYFSDCYLNQINYSDSETFSQYGNLYQSYRLNERGVFYKINGEVISKERAAKINISDYQFLGGNGNENNPYILIKKS